MKTYTEVILHEGEIALSKGFSGDDIEPSYQRVHLIASIFEKSPEVVRGDIIRSRDTPETYRRVSGR